MNSRIFLGFVISGILVYTSGCSTDYQSPTRATSVRPVAPSTSAEEAFWKRATELPFSIQRMEEYLQKYPRGIHAPEATQILQDEATMDEIERQGAGDAFIIPSEATPKFFTGAREANTQRGRTIFHQEGGIIISARTVFGNLMVPVSLTSGPMGSPLAPCGARSVFVIEGMVENIIGDTNDPIRLAYLRNIGLVVIGGKGKVLDRSGQTIYSCASDRSVRASSEVSQGSSGTTEETPVAVDLGKFAVIGIFRISSLWSGDDLQHYRIVDASGRGKTLCYAMPVGEALKDDLEQYLGRKVGLVGDIMPHPNPQLAAALVKFSQVVTLD